MINVAVVGHVARQNQAHRLARTWGARLFLDSGQLGEWVNHRRAWLWAADRGSSPWSLVLQDDALPTQDMLTDLMSGLETLPDEGLVSLYLGTGYPRRWQPRISHLMASWRPQTGPSWAISNHLLHGVAVAAPTAWAADLVDATNPRLPYDETLSTWARRNRRPVFYTLPSLVDHADQRSLIDHADGKPRILPRRAWQIGRPVWNGLTVRL